MCYIIGEAGAERSFCDDRFFLRKQRKQQKMIRSWLLPQVRLPLDGGSLFNASFPLHGNVR